MPLRGSWAIVTRDPIGVLIIPLGREETDMQTLRARGDYSPWNRKRWTKMTAFRFIDQTTCFSLSHGTSRSFALRETL